MTDTTTAPLVDLSRRRVWLGLTIPGKKMACVLAAAEAMSQRDLVRLYQGPPYKAVVMTAVALHALAAAPDDAVLTDVRDFLNFRFRPSSAELWPEGAAHNTLRSGRLPEGVDGAHPDLAIVFTIDALDALAGDSSVDPKPALASLTALLRATARSLAPADNEAAAEYLDAAEKLLG